jgi:GNAT superfamily N-acetyltransferase
MKKIFTLSFKPLDGDTWNDLVTLFGARGACGGCWCMSWRLSPAEFRERKGEGNKKSLYKLVKAEEPLGVLAYDGSRPVGWCAVAPREHFPRLANSKVLAPVDRKPVWSITCLFVDKGYRRQGVSAELIKATAAYARKQGATIVEGYPNDISESLPDAFVWTGLLPAYRKAGFTEVARRSKQRPIVRKSFK